MIIYRIAKTDYVRDLSGIGARLYGGRWSPPGIPVVHASENRALAVLEFYVHTSRRFIPPGLSIASIEISDNVSVKNIVISDLPPDWKEYPAPTALQDIGRAWVKSADVLLLRVPSAQVASEHNILINPAHQEIVNVRIKEVEDFAYDRRLMAQQKSVR
jgi:RES domain-containing protein